VFADKYERSNSMSHYEHLSVKERGSILKLSAEGKGIWEISRALGRSAGTVRRENEKE
jgi:IS30 family transposase